MIVIEDWSRAGYGCSEEQREMCRVMLFEAERLLFLLGKDTCGFPAYAYGLCVLRKNYSHDLHFMATSLLLELFGVEDAEFSYSEVIRRCNSYLERNRF